MKKGARLSNDEAATLAARAASFESDVTFKFILTHFKVSVTEEIRAVIACKPSSSSLCRDRLDAWMNELDVMLRAWDLALLAMVSNGATRGRNKLGKLGGNGNGRASVRQLIAGYVGRLAHARHVREAWARGLLFSGSGPNVGT